MWRDHAAGRAYAVAVVVVVPFRAGGKSRLPVDLRAELALAMLGDVVAAAVAVGDVRVVTGDPGACLVADELGATAVADPGGGQGAAVAAGLAAADGPCLVVNADVPRVRSSDLHALAAPAKAGRVGLVAARDGTTNALSLPFPEVFRPLYGPGSAAQFRAHVAALALALDDLSLPNIAEDVDTPADLDRVGPRSGPRTRALLEVIVR
jgi:2-phospho-L-lactate guanylyltransferase